MLDIERTLVRYRGLVGTLTARELKARYRGSVLGFFWSLANPLLLFAVYAFVFGYIFDGGRFGGTEPYALFLITGLFPWVWASSSLLEGTVSLSANAGLIRKAVFPIEVLPTVSVLANLVHFLLALPILGVALVVGRQLGYDVGGWGALLLPAVIVLELIALLGMCLGLAALNVHFKDVKDLLANLLTLLFFMAPIIYSLSAIQNPLLQGIIRLNPFTSFTVGYHRVLFEGTFPEPELWLQMAAVTVVSWLVGGWLFARLSETIAEAV